MTDRGIVFNIQHFSIHDGPGIRTTVFKRLSLEMSLVCQSRIPTKAPEQMLTSDGLNTKIVGEEKTVDEVIEEVLKDLDFYEESGGGMTLSGGKSLPNLTLP